LVVTDDELGGFRVTIPAVSLSPFSLGCGFTAWLAVLPFLIRDDLDDIEPLPVNP
jgi:hypothetical protein